MKKTSIFDYEDYRKFVRDLLATFPKKGHGQFRRIAEELRTDTVTISQVFAGKRELTVEQAHDLSNYLGLTELESKYFFTLVLKHRTSYHKLRAALDEDLKLLKKQSKDLKKILKSHKEMTDDAKAIFYTDWIYSAIRIAVSVPKLQNVESIASFFKMKKSRVLKILRFLQEYELVVEKDGSYKLGTGSTHLEASSPFVKARQISWRLKVTEQMDAERFPDHLFYTGPCSLSKKDYEAFRAELVELIQRFVKRVSDSSPEVLACFNIDFCSLDSSA